MIQLADIPSKVYQTDASPAKGNALQVCIASLFDQPLELVPNFIELECGYEQGIQEYLESSSRCRATKIPVTVVLESKDDYKGKLCILRGKSPRGDFGHVVVARVAGNGKFEMIHDPHPHGSFLDEEQPYGWCMFFEDKAQLT